MTRTAEASRRLRMEVSDGGITRVRPSWIMSDGQMGADRSVISRSSSGSGLATPVWLSFFVTELSLSVPLGQPWQTNVAKK
jgi:hypothetical protein